MTDERLQYLKEESKQERLSYGELIEIEEAFAKLDPKTLRDLPENAMADDMLDEIEDARRKAEKDLEMLAKLAVLDETELIEGVN